MAEQVGESLQQKTDVAAGKQKPRAIDKIKALFSKKTPREVLATFAEPSPTNTIHEDSLLHRKTSRREVLKGIGKVAATLAVSGGLAEFLVACTPEERPLTNAEKEALTSVKIFNDTKKRIEKQDERRGYSTLILRSLQQGIAAIKAPGGVEDAHQAFQRTYRDITKGEDADNNKYSNFLAFSAITSGANEQRMRELVSSAQAVPDTNQKDAFVLAGYSAMFGRSVEEIKVLYELSKSKVDNDSLLPALLEGDNPQDTIALYDKVRKKNNRQTSEITFLAQRNNSDVDETFKLIERHNHYYMSDSGNYRLALAQLSSGRSEEIIDEMYIASSEHVSFVNGAESEIAAALVLAGLDKSPGAQLFAMRSPVGIDSGGGTRYQHSTGYQNEYFR